MIDTPERRSHDLDELFRKYRAACGDPEPGANFMPQLWQRIESRQTFTTFLQRMTSGLVTAAVALTLVMAAFLYIPQNNAAIDPQTYVEALAASYPENAELFEPVQFDYSDYSDAAGKL